MSINCWAEFRTAMVVAKLGSASAAATALGLHRATVTRHIETVEAALGTTLFLRHSRGLTMTDAGKEMLEVAGRIDDIFADLQGKTRNKTSQLSGELIITSLKGVAPLIMPAIRAFKTAYPTISVSFVSGTELAQLECGEAHIAVRAGRKPSVPGYVAHLFRRVQFGFYAHRDYVHEMQSRKQKVGLGDYKYIGPSDDVADIRSPYTKWLNSTVPNADFVLRVNDFESNLPAILAGLGVGVLADHVAEGFDDLVAIVPPSRDRSVSLWIITHRDLTKVAKVQKFVSILTESTNF
ncbi:MAG: LysR family transcriptional regulator [Pseudomonadota bacterium]